MNVPYYIGWKASRILFKMVLRAHVSGRENLPPTGGFILACNHLSYYDPLFVGCWVPRDIYYFAKEELFSNRVFAGFLKRVNTLPVRRSTIDRRALKTAVATVKAGNGLTVFPEGTRARRGELLRPKPGVGVIARQAECPIVPAYLSGTDKLRRCLWGRQRLRLIYGKPLSTQWVKSFPIGKDGYQEIARGVMTEIARLKEVIMAEQQSDMAGGRPLK